MKRRQNVLCRNYCMLLPKKKGAPAVERTYPNYRRYPRARKYRQYMLPRNTVLTQLTGITESALHTYACFYKGTLLLAPDAQSLSAYVDALENGDVLDGTSVYEEGCRQSFSLL